MQAIVLFRKSLESEGEFDIARKHMEVVEYRSQVPPGSLVIPRYSCLPFYKELEVELTLNGSRVINTHAQHRWIADVMAWAGPDCLLERVTPKTWDNWANLPTDKSFVVKGRTNSRKNLWDTHMFAESRTEIPQVARRLLDDTFIGEQGLVVREYVPLVELVKGINGQPITNEWRTFWLSRGPGDYVMLAKGFYWGTHPEVKPNATWTPKAAIFASHCAGLISATGAARFFVLDIAEKWKYADPDLSAEDNEGDWTLIEVNDGSMSGLGFVDARVLYSNLARELASQDREVGTR